MTLLFGTNSLTAGDNITLANGQDAYITANATRASANGVGLAALFTGHAIEVQGHVFGDAAGIALGDVGQSTSRINVGLNGSVTGRSNGIETDGSSISVANAGQISGNVGLRHDGGSIGISNTGNITGSFGSAMDVDAESGVITNFGNIVSSFSGSGITLNNTTVVNGLAAKVVNHGLISGPFQGIRGAFSDGNTIENYGTVRGISLGTQADQVINGGLITGQLAMGSGADTYEGMGDGTVEGVIEGGLGADVLTGGDRRDRIDGGADNDILRGGDGRDRVSGGTEDDVVMVDADGVTDRYFGDDGFDLIDFSEVGDDLTIKLNNGVARSAASGRDKLDGFERVQSGDGDDLLVAEKATQWMKGGGGDDVLRGSDKADDLRGQQGDDTLRGNGGKDRLIGGDGNDRLLGGNGADIFKFADDFGQDVITDFNATNDNEKIDLSAVSAITGMSDLRNNHLTTLGNDVEISAGTNTILLEDVSQGDLQGADFIF